MSHVVSKAVYVGTYGDPPYSAGLRRMQLVPPERHCGRD